MKKTLIVLAAAVGGIFAAGSQKGLSSSDPAGHIVDEIRAQASDELRRAFADEVEAFFESDDLSVTLGIDTKEQDKLETSIKHYIESYDMDEEKLDEARASLGQLLENARGLSADELQDKIDRIFR